MQNAHVCVECAMKCPAQFDMELPEARAVTALLEPEIVAAKALIRPAAYNLVHFQFKSPGMAAGELLDHIIQHREIRCGIINEPMPFLDVAVSDSNRTVFRDSATVILGKAQIKRMILADASGDGATMKLSSRKLDALGIIKAHSVLVNSEVQLSKMENHTMLARSLAIISEHERDSAAKNKQDKTSGLLLAIPGAKAKIVLQGVDVSKLTKKDMCSLLIACYGETVEDSKHNKDAL